jgi:hypothetical protein
VTNIFGEILTVQTEGGSYYIGDIVNLFGTNTYSEFTYLILTGPNLPSVWSEKDSHRSFWPSDRSCGWAPGGGAETP